MDARDSLWVCGEADIRERTILPLRMPCSHKTFCVRKSSRDCSSDCSLLVLIWSLLVLMWRGHIVTKKRSAGRNKWSSKETAQWPMLAVKHYISNYFLCKTDAPCNKWVVHRPPQWRKYHCVWWEAGWTAWTKICVQGWFPNKPMDKGCHSVPPQPSVSELILQFFTSASTQELSR